jgi:hypothetical protein
MLSKICEFPSLEKHAGAKSKGEARADFPNCPLIKSTQKSSSFPLMSKGDVNSRVRRFEGICFGREWDRLLFVLCPISSSRPAWVSPNRLAIFVS